MKRIAIIFVIALSFTNITSVFAQGPAIQAVVAACEEELTGMCGKVTRGKGRILSCLYAFEDQLSGKCEYSLYQAANVLERQVQSLVYVAGECAEDLEKHCAAVAVGEGRLAQCLLDNESDLESGCSTAIEKTGLTVE